MQRIMNAVTQLPDYIRELLTGPYLVYLVLALFVFLVVLFFNGRVAHVLRQIFVIAMVATGIIAYFKRNYPLIWLCLAALVILLIYRLLVYLIITIRQTRINRRIEKRALEKAEMRRGARRRSFISDEHASASGSEGTADASANTDSDAGAGNKRPDEVSEAIHPFSDDLSTETEKTLPRSSAPESLAEGSLSRAQVFDAMKMLSDLKDMGVLSEEEFIQKKSDLYARLG